MLFLKKNAMITRNYCSVMIFWQSCPLKHKLGERGREEIRRDWTVIMYTYVCGSVHVWVCVSVWVCMCVVVVMYIYMNIYTHECMSMTSCSCCLGVRTHIYTIVCVCWTFLYGISKISVGFFHPVSECVYKCIWVYICVFVRVYASVRVCVFW